MKRLPSAIVCVLLIDLVLALSFLFNFLIGEPFGFVTRQINLDGEANLTAWYSSMKLFVVSALLALVARRRLVLADKRGWMLTALALLFLALSADEVAQVHEWLGEETDVFLSNGTRDDTFFQHTGIWMFVLGIPFTAILLAALYALRGVFSIAPGTRLLFTGGALFWLFGALGVEILSNIPESNTLGMVISVLAEELSEMVGVTFMLWAAYAFEREDAGTLQRVTTYRRSDATLAHDTRS